MCESETDFIAKMASAKRVSSHPTGRGEAAFAESDESAATVGTMPVYAPVRSL